MFDHYFVYNGLVLSVFVSLARAKASFKFSV